MVREVEAACSMCGQAGIFEITDAEIKLVEGKDGFKDMTEPQIAQQLAQAKAIKYCKCEGAAKLRKQVITRNFEGFVKGELVNFMELNELEEISITDGYGNKAKLKKKESGQIEVTKTIKDVM